jgi:hypothetical protein
VGQVANLRPIANLPLAAAGAESFFESYPSLVAQTLVFAASTLLSTLLWEFFQTGKAPRCAADVP